MPLLTARFEIPIPGACLIQIPDDGAIQFPGSHVDFDVTVQLLLSESWRTKGKEEADWTTTACAILITVTREEPEPVPGIAQTPSGGQDHTSRGMFLLKRLDSYKAAALEVANRVIEYFRYCLMTPSLRPIARWDQSLASPIWYDANGAELGPSRVVVAQPVPGVRGELGVQKLTMAQVPALAEYVKSPSEAPLDLTLLSDAQTAWFEGSLRRAVLELAICAEVMVKRRFFAASSPAGSAFDYLEDRSKVSVRVLELLDPIAVEAFGSSYRLAFPQHHRNIDLLFRCRNKIAHRGELIYRDDSGQLHQPSREEVAAWWASVAHLRTWLSQL